MPFPLITGAINYWRNLSLTVKLIGYIGVAAGALVSVAQAWPLVEPYWYAHRAYVRAYDADHENPWHQRVIKVQLQQDKDRRSSLLNEEAKWELELQGTQAQSLPQYHALIQQRVDRIKEDLNSIDAEEKSLFNEKAGKE